jgi:hypothetical protein
VHLVQLERNYFLMPIIIIIAIIVRKVIYQVYYGLTLAWGNYSHSFISLDTLLISICVHIEYHHKF